MAHKETSNNKEKNIMVYKETIQNEDIRYFIESPFFYNLHNSVGWGCKNNFDDVLLIQFFWNTFAELAEYPKLVDDGIFGPKTCKAIKKFQYFNNNFSDGVVTTIDGTRMKGTKSGVTYTILDLNFYYRDQRKIYYHDLRMDPKLPQPLVQKLTIL